MDSIYMFSIVLLSPLREKESVLLIGQDRPGLTMSKYMMKNELNSGYAQERTKSWCRREKCRITNYGISTTEENY
jgi:hypothetical protein